MSCRRRAGLDQSWIGSPDAARGSGGTAPHRSKALVVACGLAAAVLGSAYPSAAAAPLPANGVYAAYTLLAEDAAEGTVPLARVIVAAGQACPHARLQARPGRHGRPAEPQPGHLPGRGVRGPLPVRRGHGGHGHRAHPAGDRAQAAAARRPRRHRLQRRQQPGLRRPGGLAVRRLRRRGGEGSAGSGRPSRRLQLPRHPGHDRGERPVKRTSTTPATTRRRTRSASSRPPTSARTPPAARCRTAGALGGPTSSRPRRRCWRRRLGCSCAATMISAAAPGRATSTSWTHTRACSTAAAS